MMHYYSIMMNWLLHLDRQEWLMLLVAAMVVGCLCMRGLGSRLNP